MHPSSPPALSLSLGVCPLLSLPPCFSPSLQPHPSAPNTRRPPEPSWLDPLTSPLTSSLLDPGAIAAYGARLRPPFALSVPLYARILLYACGCA
eukprot:2592295-Rhodomonas_salina.2